MLEVCVERPVGGTGLKHGVHADERRVRPRRGRPPAEGADQDRRLGGPKLDARKLGVVLERGRTQAG